MSGLTATFLCEIIEPMGKQKGDIPKGDSYAGSIAVEEIYARINEHVMSCSDLFSSIFHTVAEQVTVTAVENRGYHVLEVKKATRPKGGVPKQLKDQNSKWSTT